jgi:ribA/ribD-fused uncharacterized protein
MIKEFKNEYDWLSNFFPCVICLNGRIFPSIEHAFQSEKSSDSEWKKKCQETLSPGKIKQEARKLEINRKEWDKINLKVMEICIDQKFNQEPFRTKLLETGEEEIQEGNNWNDEFWGINLKTGKGLNHLGKLIMKKRDQLNNKIF